MNEPNARATPLQIAPTIPGHVIFDRDSLGWMRRHLQPPPDKPVSASFCLHLLRLYGKNATFQHPTLKTGDTILAVLTNDTASASFFGAPHSLRTTYGVRFPSDKSESGRTALEVDAHRDHTLAVLSELGVPLSFPVTVNNERLSLSEVLKDSIATFHLQQKELAWTATAYILLLPPHREWTNRFGERFTFDQLISELLSRPLHKDSCSGTHLLVALTLAARANDINSFLTEPMRLRLHRFLDAAVTAACETQQADGSWLPTWNRALHESASPPRSATIDGPIDRLLVTGHLTEWLLYLPRQHQPHLSTFERAAKWLQAELVKALPTKDDAVLCPYAHAFGVLQTLSPDMPPALPHPTADG